ncbi:hypothetical protein ACXR2W_10600 [Leucobacter sp. HY1908]
MAQRFSFSSTRESLTLARRALRSWTRRQYLVAVSIALGFAVLVGVVTVLIPNPLFAREIATVWWNYPVLLVNSVGVGMLAATYVSPSATGARDTTEATPADRRTARFGLAGSLLTWFAVGCPVCNKIALLALGYAGAITWFAPLQPILALAAVLLTGIALVWRLKGQVACSVTLPATFARGEEPHPLTEMETNR